MPVCVHTERLPLTPRRSPLPVTPPHSRALLWFHSHLGNCLSARDVATCFRARSARLSVTSRGRRPTGGHHTHPLQCSLNLQPPVHPLPPSPCLEIHRDDGSRAPKPQHAEEEPQAQRKELHHHHRDMSMYNIFEHLFSMRKSISGPGDPSTVRTPQGPADGQAEEGEQTLKRARRGRPCPRMPSTGRGVSGTHWDCHGDDARLSRRGCSPSCGDAAVKAA